LYDLVSSPQPGFAGESGPGVRRKRASGLFYFPAGFDTLNRRRIVNCCQV